MRERGVALTTAVITKNETGAPTHTIESEVDIASTDMGFEMYVIWMLWGEEPDAITVTNETEEAWKLHALLRELRELEGLPLTSRRRSNPRARSMTRQGRKYAVRKDHGTTAFYKEIKAINAEIEEGKRSPRTVRHQRNKNKAASGDPRRYRTSQR